MIEQHLYEYKKNAPRKIYFLTDFIKTHLSASLDDGIGKCHQSQTWRYQGATVGSFQFSIFNWQFSICKTTYHNFCLSFAAGLPIQLDSASFPTYLATLAKSLPQNRGV